MSMPNTICWFSCGAASAVATKITLLDEPSALIVRIAVDNEHPDNERFANDCAKWFGREILTLKNQRYKDCWDVWEQTKFLNGINGARCTTELKKKVRQTFEKIYEIKTQIFGFTYEEQERAERFVNNNPEVKSTFPLIAAQYTKAMCFHRIQNASIELPEMYKLGYKNANCVGCVKGKKGYWNKIRRDFPEVFERMALLEEKLGRRVMNEKSLRELTPSEGNHRDLELPDCGLFCGENA